MKRKAKVGEYVRYTEKQRTELSKSFEREFGIGPFLVISDLDYGRRVVGLDGKPMAGWRPNPDEMELDVFMTAMAGKNLEDENAQTEGR